MASHKLVTIIGIHSREQLLNVSDDEAASAWKEAQDNPDFVAGALFKGGHVAPLSGQKFCLVEAKCKEERTS
jgi:hypothetical protein